MAPAQLGPYRIGKPLGKGGMGTVFAAVEEISGEPAAVKVLSAAMGREEGFRDRFAAEIESLRKLRHPNIVRLLGYGVDEDLNYYAMELVDGRSLDDEIRAGRVFGWREVIDIGLQVCRALRHAHDRGVIHRDVKPANLLISADGSIKLSDFGIAKLFGNSGLTSNGGVIGTADFMSPEQADGRPVTHRCDLYSLGAVLYALLAGRPPFRAGSVVEILQMQRFAEPEPLRKFARQIPGELEELVRSLMHKEPERRIPTALAACRRLEMIRDLPEPPVSEAVAEPNPIHDASDPDDIPTADDPTSAASQLAAAPINPKAVTARPRHHPSGEMLTTALPSGAAPIKSPPTTAKYGLGDGQRRFTPVGVDDDDWAGVESWGEKAVGLVSPGTWILIVSLLIVGFSTWYMVQPPSADRLYDRIVAATQSDRVENLAQLDQDIKTFLTYYPGDRRSRQVEQAQDELFRAQLKRKMDRLARRATEAGTLSEVQTAYLEALRYETIRPGKCRDLLRSLVDVYSGEEGLSSDDRQILELSQQKIAEINQREKPVDIDAQQDRIDRIEALANTNTEDAVDKLRGLRTLLEDKPGVEALLQRIDRLLEKYTAP